MAVMKIRGEDGKFHEVPSIQGEPGATPNITIGTVETVPPGSNADAEITGETPNLKMNIRIPRGDDGITPVKGVDYWTEEDRHTIVNEAKTDLQPQVDAVTSAVNNAAQSAQEAANSASAAHTAQQAAEAAAAVLPKPTNEDAGKVPVVNPEGDGYIFGDVFGSSGPYDALYSETVEEPDTMEVLVVAEKPIKSIAVYAITPADDMMYSLQCYARVNNNGANQIIFGIGNLFQTSNNKGVVFFEKEKNLGLYMQKSAKKMIAWYDGTINEEVYFETSPNVIFPHNTVTITKNNSGKTYPLTAGTKLIVGVKYE